MEVLASMGTNICISQNYSGAAKLRLLQKVIFVQSMNKPAFILHYQNYYEPFIFL